ncbi:hypothetical protein GA0061078_0874 [Bifidobacterium bohemicum]|uniref:Permeases of the major facilitator superfamily n=1 Tax=Bifidobacterium bohemicum DSM 22767 TaxID=1437606 RepID=A0A086ZEW3_9BIFI|nr:Pr6Pr family membrane protein [Bifidobacterium bohemicum]KFI45063.1 hypothetical protein BBOH_1325 [Bifidobacterium bohemicum DSM 22767]SCB92447.1 hypothetical protein GA0061078_0874 [Bifidobacterium bohemicum]
MKYAVGIYRLLIAFLCLAWTSVAWGEPDYWVFFTYQTNFVLGLVMAWAGIARLIDGKQPPAWLKGVLTLYILITGIVGAFILPPGDPAKAKYVFGVVTAPVLHKVVPVLALLDFVLFDAHRRFKWHYVFSWLIYFPIYIAFVLIRAGLWPNAGPADDGSSYPYGFIDVSKIGWRQFGVNIVTYLAAFAVLAFVVFLVDRALPKKPLLK